MLKLLKSHDMNTTGGQPVGEGKMRGSQPGWGRKAACHGNLNHKGKLTQIEMMTREKSESSADWVKTAVRP
jgi:hypothetical protein